MLDREDLVRHLAEGRKRSKGEGETEKAVQTKAQPRAFFFRRPKHEAK